MMFQDLVEEYQIIPERLPQFLVDKVVWFYSLSTQVRQLNAKVKDEPKPIQVNKSKLTKAKVLAVEKELTKRFTIDGQGITLSEMLKNGRFVYKIVHSNKHWFLHKKSQGIIVSKALYSCVDLPATWEEGLLNKTSATVDSELEALLVEADKALCIALLTYFKENPDLIDGVVGNKENRYTKYHGYYDALLMLCPDLKQMLIPGAERVERFKGLSDVNPTWRTELTYFSEYHIDGCVYAKMALYINNMLNREFTVILCFDTVEPVIYLSNDNGVSDLVQKYNPYDDFKLHGENQKLIDSRFDIFLGDLTIEKFTFRIEQNRLSGVIQQMLVELT